MRRFQRCSRGCQITLSRRLQGTWPPTRKRQYHSCREYTNRWCLGEEQQRVRRGSEEIEEVALPQVHNDKALKRNPKLHHSFVRDVKSRGMLSATLSPLEHVGFYFVHKSKGGLRLVLDARRSNANFLHPPGVRLLSSEGFGRIEIALPDGVDVDSEAAVELRNTFSIAIAKTDVRDCFHRFRMLLSLSRFLLSQSSSRTCVLNDWRHARGTGPWRRILPFGHVGEYSPWASLGRCFWPRVASEDKACLAPSLRRTSGESTTQLIHDRGPRLVFVAGEQGHGGAYVFAYNLEAICDNVALSQKMVSEWSDIFEPLGLALHKPKSTWAERGPRDRIGRTRTFLTCDLQAILDDAARVDGTGTCHRPLHFRGSRVSRNVVHGTQMLPLHSVPLP